MTDLNRKAGLADSSRASERYQKGRGKERFNLPSLSFPADQRRHRIRHISPAMLYRVCSLCQSVSIHARPLARIAPNLIEYICGFRIRLDVQFAVEQEAQIAVCLN